MKPNKLSNPSLVSLIRRLMRETATYRILHEGRESPDGPLLRAAMDEATKRNITIEHPELT